MFAIAMGLLETVLNVPGIDHRIRMGIKAFICSIKRSTPPSADLSKRVGRGDKPSTCLLIYKGPLGEVAQARLKIMRETEDGFRIAEEDLKLRGEGELLGTRQSGAPGFRLASIEAHQEFLEIAREDARYVLTRDPELQSARGEALRILLYLFERDEAVRLLRAG